MDRLGTERNALTDNGEGRVYMKELAEAVEQSDRIIVTEHSHVDDVLDELIQPQRPKDYRPIIFTTREVPYRHTKHGRRDTRCGARGHFPAASYDHLLSRK